MVAAGALLDQARVFRQLGAGMFGRYRVQNRKVASQHHPSASVRLGLLAAVLTLLLAPIRHRRLRYLEALGNRRLRLGPDSARPQHALPQISRIGSAHRDTLHNGAIAPTAKPHFRSSLPTGICPNVKIFMLE